MFIDDYESCADYDFITQYSKNTQIILSTVHKKQPLQIADYNDKNKSTVVKQKIAGYKTYKHFYKNNTLNLLNVA